MFDVSKNRVFLDSDGVFAHFDQHCFNNFGSFPKELRDDDMWAMIHAYEAWWPSMPPMPGAFELWAALRHLDPIVLTGCPKTNFDNAVLHKKEWWKRNFDHDNVICCLSRDKATHMINPGDILVDDMYKNIKRWRAAGGIGVLHRSNEETLARLAELGVNLTPPAPVAATEQPAA